MKRKIRQFNSSPLQEVMQASNTVVEDPDLQGVVIQIQQKLAQTKLSDLNAGSIEEAMSIVAGTARSMGIEITES